MNNHKRFILIWLIFFIAIIPNVANGETTQEKGFKIATAMERRDDGWVGQTAEVEFVINAEKRRGAIYKFRTQWIEVPDDGDKGIIIYDFPADMRGVVSLAHLHKFVPNDMWIFIPRNRRVKRFSSQKKNSSFLGSEFTSEDLNRGEVEKYTYDWVKDEEYEELPCSVIDRFPVEANSGYIKQRLWIDQKEHRVLKMEYYNLKDDHIKTLYFKDYQKHLDYFWRESERTMVNEKTGQSTTGHFRNWKLKVELNKNDFTSNRIRQLR